MELGKWDNLVQFRNDWRVLNRKWLFGIVSCSIRMELDFVQCEIIEEGCVDCRSSTVT